MDSSTSHLVVVSAFDTWGEVYSQEKTTYIPFGLDSYAEMDFVSIDFVRSLGLKPCLRKQHNHRIPHIEAAGRSSLTTYGVFHLRCSITDRWGW